MDTLKNQKPTMAWKERMDEGDDIFTPTRIAESDKLLDTYLDSLSKAKDTAAIWKAIETVVKGFDQLNVDEENFIETMEREELAEFIQNAAEAYGLKYEGDVTEQWRMEW